MYLWLGVSKHKKEVLKGLPLGYEDTHALRRSCRIVGTPPDTVKYEGKINFRIITIVTGKLYLNPFESKF